MFIVYKTTNLVNGKIYVGIHDENSCVKEFYFGSGNLLKKAIKKYGKENFSREILFEYETLESAIEKEIEIVNEDFIKRKDTYNITIGGCKPPNSKEWWTDEHREKISNRMKGNSYRKGKKDSEETRLKKSLSMSKSETIGRWERTEEYRKYQSERMTKFLNTEKNPMNNIESREKVSKSKIGRKKMVSPCGGFYKMIKKEEIDFYLSVGWVYNGC